MPYAPDGRFFFSRYRMNKTAFLALAATGIAGLSACTHLRSPTDDQLIALLHADRTRPNMPQIDVPASQCLRAWSNDANLVAGLPPGFAAEGSSRATCRNRIDGWLADGQRNPANFSFEDISAPAVVRRVVAIAEPAAAKSMGDVAQQGGHAPPPMFKPGLAPSANIKTSGPHTDLGTTQALLKEADNSCKLAQQKATEAGASLALQRFAKYCGSYIERAQTTLSGSASANPQQVDSIARAAKGISITAQRVMQPGRLD